MTAMERELAVMMVDTLDLDMAPDDIDPRAPLFREGLALDSIDALEIAIHLKKNYQILIKVEDEESRRIFASLSDLASFVERNRPR